MILKLLLPILFVTSLIAPFGTSRAASACDASEYRQFDFWIGEWEVYTPAGKLAGTNRIEREHGGCILHENYSTPSGYSGQSFNIYDASRKVWHQTWVDSSGLLLLLEGGIRDGKMVLEGQTTSDGVVSKQRITWTPNKDGTVRQFWESTDETGKWQVAFDGLYRQKK